MSKNEQVFPDFGFSGVQQQYFNFLDKLWQPFANQPNYMQQSQIPFAHLSRQTQDAYRIFSELANLVMQTNRQQLDWNKQMEALNQAISTMKTGLNDSSHFFSPLQFWQQPADGFSSSLFSQYTNPAQIYEKYLSIPGIGYTREQQDRVQEGKQLWQQFASIADDYKQAMIKVGKQALDTLQRRLTTLAEQDQPVNSLRQLYDMWVNANEEAYGAFVITEDHSILYGELVNALMQLKKHINENMDKILKTMNLPTQEGINSTLKREKILRQQFVALQQQVLELQQQMQKKTSMAATKSSTSVPSKKNTVHKKVPIKKKSLAKKAVTKKTAKKTTKK